MEEFLLSSQNIEISLDEGIRDDCDRREKIPDISLSRDLATRWQGSSRRFLLALIKR